MPLQARAEATRRKILDSAVDLFADLGYGGTGLADILQRANVSKGAFYYHFDSKEAVAAAIIDEYNKKLIKAALHFFDPAAPTLEGVIRASLNSAIIIQTDKLATVGNELMQGLGQISAAAGRIYADWSESYVEILRKATSTWKLRDGVEPADVAEGIWTAMVGSHLLSAAMGDDRVSRLSRSWRLIFRLLAPQEAQASLYAALDEAVAAGYHTV